MPVRFLDCIGSHFMTGIQQGRLAKQAIHAAWEIFGDSQHLDMIRKSKLAPKPLYLLHCQQKAENLLKKFVKDNFPEQHERIKGIASGAGISDKIVYLLQAMEMELMPKQGMYALGSGTVLGLTSAATTGGEQVLICNFDYTLPFHDMILVRRNKPMAGCQTLEATLAFLSGTFAGLNEHGLAIVHTFAYPTDSLSIKSVPITIILQEALETCHTTEEAVRLIDRYARDAGANIILADASDDMRVMETSRSSSSQRLPENGRLVATNHYITKEMSKLQIPLVARWGDKALPRLRGESIYKSSLARYDRAAQLLSAALLDPDRAETLAGDHGDGPAGDESVCRHGNVFNTMASVIIYPRRKTIRVAAGKPCETKFEEFTMKRF